jgi:hypothetical protein
MNAVDFSPLSPPSHEESRDELSERLAAVIEEIRHYPTPIAGCDDQFNYLCEKRDALAGALALSRQGVGRDR